MTGLKTTAARGLNSVRGAVRVVRTFLTRREEGATMAEYALLVALIALVVIAGVTLLGTTLSGTFSNIANKLSF
jgi:pilus assembly protein Flp/PilA